jgi:hypothetical protein
MDGLSVMELLTPPCPVLLSRIHLPIVFYQHLIYCLIIDVGRFVSATRPMTINVNGEPMDLRSEIEVGSIVRVHSVDGYLRTVQMIQRKIINPFASAHQAVG